MAGLYPDVPGRRMALDADGSVGLRWDESPTLGPTQIVQLTAGQKTILNNESTLDAYSFAGQATGRMHIFWVFPELRDIDGWFMAKGLGSVISKFQFRSSVDSTNGIDGTWVTHATAVDPPNFANLYRSGIVATSLVAKRAVSFTWDGFSGSGGTLFFWQSTHLYGDIAAGETPDRLIFIDEDTGLTFTLDQDWGDVPRGSSEDKSIRLKNNSATLTANTISYAAQSLTGTSNAWYTFTAPGGATFASSQNIASLAPTVSSGIIVMRRITPGTDPLGLQAARINAQTTSWT